MKHIKRIYFKFINRFSNIYAYKKNNIQNIQKRLLIKMLKYANKHCNYYSNLKIHIKNENTIQEYPFLTKDIIKREFNNLTSDEIKFIPYEDAYTGGSTGEPLHFYRQTCIDGTFQKKYWSFLGYKKGDKILAMDGTAINDVNLKKNKFWGLKNQKAIPYGEYYLSSLYLNENNIDLYIEFILEYKPDFIRGYPSFIYHIAKYMDENNININFRIKAIQLTSESSFPYQWDVISKVFKTNICMQYGHTESSIFAYTYDNSMKYKVEPLYGYTEVIKDNGEKAKEGEMGEIVVTSFYNFVMPLIRYKTGDYAVVSKYDKNGIILEQIMGRTQDYVFNRNGDQVLLTALIFGQHFKALGNIKKWQIIQEEQGKIIMRIIKGLKYNKEDEKEIRELFDVKGNIDVIFEYVENIETTKRGKSKLLIQNIIND